MNWMMLYGSRPSTFLFFVFALFPKREEEGGNEIKTSLLCSSIPKNPQNHEFAVVEVSVVVVVAVVVKAYNRFSFIYSNTSL